MRAVGTRVPLGCGNARSAFDRMRRSAAPFVWRIINCSRTNNSPHRLESRRLSAAALLRIQSRTLTHAAGENAATASFRPRPPRELQFADGICSNDRSFVEVVLGD